MNPAEVPTTIPSAQTAREEYGASAVVRLSEVTKLFGRFAALRGVTAEFGSGRMYALLGDNGAGKSTLLRVIAGLTAPTRGAVTVLGGPPSRSAYKIGFMGHAPLLYDDMSARENLTYFARLYGIADGESCAAAIEAVGLDPGLKRRVGQYSQGMRQRLSLARAMVHDPELLLLDEPFSNVDMGSAGQIVGFLAGLQSKGKTLFVVTHQAALLQDAANESIVMAAGQIVARTPGVPTPAEMLSIGGGA